MSVDVTAHGPVTTVTINRPERRNAVDQATALALYEAFLAFDADDGASVAVLAGAGGTFCAGADLQALAQGQSNPLDSDGPAPMGPSRLNLSKPVIAAVEGHAVAGGLELALWCDLRVASQTAVFGVYCRRFGVPLIDLGTIRLPRLIGQSRALDMILTGRGVDAAEAQAIGLANRVCAAGDAFETAVKLATELAALPQLCLRSDRATVLDQWSLPHDAAWRLEFERGRKVIDSGETRAGADRFAAGAGRHGTAVDKA
ncbi:MAG: crotonase/enoyl-CoA hydratase family protein [Rhodothalassiaceae bacterium]